MTAAHAPAQVGADGEPCSVAGPNGEPCTIDWPAHGLHSWDWDPAPPACPECGRTEGVQEMGHYGMPTREFSCLACHPDDGWLHRFQRVDV